MFSIIPGAHVKNEVGTSLHGESQRETCNKDAMAEIYHTLLELHYEDKWHKSIGAKKQAQDEGILVWEVEHHLDADLFLDEYPW